jgi:hypothetical protein
VSPRRGLLLVAAALAVVDGLAFWLVRGDDHNARVLLLDARTGATLREHAVDGGYAVVAFLHDGRVAVASLNSCPDGRGGRITVLDATLGHVVSARPVAPCVVAKLGSPDLRARFESTRGPTQAYDGGRDVIVPLAAGKLVETYKETTTGGFWLHAMTAYDAAGTAIWHRSFGQRIGVADVRGARVVVPVFGQFTEGSD